MDSHEPLDAHPSQVVLLTVFTQAVLFAGPILVTIPSSVTTITPVFSYFVVPAGHRIIIPEANGYLKIFTRIQ